MWGIRFQCPKGGKLRISQFPESRRNAGQLRRYSAEFPEKPSVVIIDEPDTLKIRGVLSFNLDEPRLVVLVSATLESPTPPART